MSIAEDAQIVRSKMARLVKDDRMSIGVAQRFISESAWWHGHPHGPTRASKHYERVTHSNGGWQIEFGANTFSVEQAIKGCFLALLDAVESAESSGAKVDEVPLRERMSLAVRGAVANYNGDEYLGYYDTYKGFMLFGTQAINVNDFVHTFWSLTEAHRICTPKEQHEAGNT